MDEFAVFFCQNVKMHATEFLVVRPANTEEAWNTVFGGTLSVISRKTCISPRRMLPYCVKISYKSALNSENRCVHSTTMG